MSSIFKSRRVPRHLIIQDEFKFNRKSRFSFIKLVGWIVLLSVVGIVLLQIGSPPTL